MEEREANVTTNSLKTRPAKRSFLGRLLAGFFAFAIPVRKTGVSRYRFVNGIVCEIKLSTVGTRYTAKFSEPLTGFLRPEFEEWRDREVSKFVQLHGAKITEDDLENESHIPLRGHIANDPRDRGFHIEN
jgi:hypothetical protein